MREIHHREVIISEEQRKLLEENERKNRRYLDIKPEGIDGKIITKEECMTFWDTVFKG